MYKRDKIIRLARFKISASFFFYFFFFFQAIDRFLANRGGSRGSACGAGIEQPEEKRGRYRRKPNEPLPGVRIAYRDR